MNTSAVIALSAAPRKASTHAGSGTYYLAIGYLRAFITLLVVTYHSVVA
jgi:hypothetical protein